MEIIKGYRWNSFLKAKIQNLPPFWQPRATYVVSRWHSCGGQEEDFSIHENYLYSSQRKCVCTTCSKPLPKPETPDWTARPFKPQKTPDQYTVWSYKPENKHLLENRFSQRKYFSHLLISFFIGDLAYCMPSNQIWGCSYDFSHWITHLRISVILCFVHSVD